MNINEALEKAVRYHKSGDIENADILYTAILESNPNHSDANHNLGLIAEELGKYEQATPLFRLALEADRNREQFWLSYLKNFLKLRRTDEAEKVLDEAVSVLEKFNRGFTEIGKFYLTYNNPSKALAFFEKANSSKNQDLELEANIGRANYFLGKYKKAVEIFTAVAVKEPDNAELWNDLGASYVSLSQIDNAITAFSKSLVLDENQANAGFNLGLALQNREISKWDNNLAKALIKLIRHPSYVNPSQLHNSIRPVLFSNSKFREVLKLLKNKQKADLNECIRCFESSELFLAYLTSCPIADLNIETMLVSFRKLYLKAVVKDDFEPRSYIFLDSLTEQLFVNEFVYYESPDETSEVENLLMLISDYVATHNSLPRKMVTALSLYRDISPYPWVNYLVGNFDYSVVYRLYVEEPQSESKIATTIKSSPVEKDISKDVMGQYEKFPYPRWVKVALNPSPINFAEYLKKQNLDINFTEKHEGDIRCLIAGCGTGHHSIGSAAGIKNYTITAIDLSSASLAYAKRKTMQLGISNIEYYKKDLLELNKDDFGVFDVIECAGVLHHLKDPRKGLKTLVNLLKPAGIIRLGLYSRMARSEISKYRDRTKITAEEIRNFRQDIIDDEVNWTSDLVKSRDFFCLSGVKDLVFHEQETQYDLNQIKELLQDSKLKFCGFDSDAQKNSKIPTKDLMDLHVWHQFESENPKFFAGMYQFWCQKI